MIAHGITRGFGRFTVTLAMLATLCMAFAGPAATLAQGTGLVDDTTYELQSGQTVTWGDPWTYDEEFSGEEEGVESVALLSSQGVMFVTTVPAALNVEEARDIFVEGMTGGAEASLSIDQGSYDGLSYSLDLYSLEGTEFGSFLLFRAGSGNTPTLAEIFLAPRTVFAAGFASAQESVAVDGEGVFNGVGGQGLQDLLDANVGQASEAEAEDPATDETTPESGDGGDMDSTPEGEDSGDGGPGGLKRGGSDDDETPEAEETPQAEEIPDEETPVDEGGGNEGGTGEVGLIDDSTYVSPTYGPELTWTSAWEVDPDRELVEDDNGIDAVSLRWTGDGPSFMTVSFAALPTVEGSVTGDFVDYWQSEEYLTEALLSAEGEVVLAESSATVGSVIFRDFTEGGTEIIIIREVRVDEANGSLVFVYFTTVPQLAVDTLPDAQEGIQLNGEPIVDFFTVDEILAEFGG